MNWPFQETSVRRGKYLFQITRIKQQIQKIFEDISTYLPMIAE